MAYYAALVSLVQLLEDIIHRDRYQNLLLDKQQIASVYEKFSLLQALLDDYSPKDREAADSLERRIRDAACQAQDIIESHISDQISSKDEAQGVQRVLQISISALPKAMLQLLQPWRCGKVRLDNVSNEYQDLENVKEEVDSTVEELMRIKRSHTAEDNLQLNYYSADAGTSNQAPSHKHTMEGVEERMITIKDQLCGEPSKLRVVSIMGMGGIGKTTLARNIFDDGLIVHRFDCRAWVTISQDYHPQKVLLDILDSMKVPTDKSSEVGELEVKIYKHLKERRYLIIMDDMWDTKVWDDMKRILPDDSNGSRIMITTRISHVAFYADRFDFYHEMQFLNEDQSWNLFREKVFYPPELEDIGRLIAKNCRGLPLAIVVVAGLLSKVNKTRRDWEEIARNVSSTVAEKDEHFSKVLSLSYNHLPHHLKPCFLYIGSFPKYYEIRVSKLIKLWIAEGFLKPIESKSLEEVAEEYLEDLVNRNLVLITKKRSNGKIKCCGIHDLLRDLCTQMISHENFLHVLDYDSYFQPTDARNVRRLFIRDDFCGSQFTKTKEFGSHVRSIIFHTHDWELLFSRSGFKLLRVLHTTEGSVFRLPNRILKLFHLKYLTVTVNKIPPSISLLQNLQTLIIERHFLDTLVSLLPSQIREMPNLRHIMSTKNLHFKCQFFDEMIVGEPFILENLQTLSWVKDVKFTNEVIEMIANLRKLKVACYEEGAVNWQKFRLDNLFHLRQLETLNIEFLNVWRGAVLGVNPLPESFAFPLMLKKLSLISCRLPWKDMAMVGSLPNLQVLKLRNSAFVGEKWELVEGEFLQLKFLLMENLDLIYWRAESTHFPTLQYLKISDCQELEEIPPEIGEISTLELVEVRNSELATKSALEMQEEQRDMGNDILQVLVYNAPWSFSKKGEERKQKIIKGLMKLQPNSRCINCNSLYPQYVCTNFWTFVCTGCSGIHREFTHQVKSVSMAKFTFQEVDALQRGGNQGAKELFFKAWDPQRRLPDHSNVNEVRQFIKNVYVDKRYAGSLDLIGLQEIHSQIEEERNEKIIEKIIKGLMKLPPNRRCFNCNSLGPQYVCINFWTFVCMRCSGIHREFTHRVKSVSLAKFTFQEVDALQRGGNQRAKELFFKAWDPQSRLSDDSNVDEVREFIKSVYVDKRYAIIEHI